MKKTLAILIATLLLLQVISIASAWEIERPSADIDIYERTENAYTNGQASVGLGVAIYKYNENQPPHFKDLLNLNVSMTANSRIRIEYWRSWESLWWIDENWLWYKQEFIGVGDDWGGWIGFPTEYSCFRFYGGLGSAEYEGVWISSNGFISFDRSNFTDPTPSNVPSPSNPNAVIAAVWTDLKIDGSASIITGLYEEGRRYFVIIWNNALHKASGNRLSFQIILSEPTAWYIQSPIWISYKSVTSINTNFAYGIEDQEGYKGIGSLKDGAELQNFNGYTIHFYQTSNSFFLKTLAISLQDANVNTEFNIRKEYEFIRGYHVELGTGAEPDDTLMFEKALDGWLALLLSKAGVMIDELFLVIDTVKVLANYQYSNAEWLELKDQYPTTGTEYIPQGAYIKAQTPYNYVDATLSIIVHWILDTPNDNGTHSLTITADATYAEFDLYGVYLGESHVYTSVNLTINPDNNNSFDTARAVIGDGRLYSRVFLGGTDIEDFYTVHAEQGQRISVYMYPPDNADFDLELYSPNDRTEARAESKYRIHGGTESIVLVADTTGDWFIKMKPYYTEPPALEKGFYSFRVMVSSDGFGENKLLIRLYADAVAEFAAFERGEIDITDSPLSKIYYDLFTSSEINSVTREPYNEHISVIPYGNEYGLFMLDINNNNNPYLGNPPNPAYPNPMYPNPTSVKEMRQAIAHLADRNQLAAIISPGFYTPLYTPVPSSMGAYIHPEIRPGGSLAHLTYPYSRAAAEAKLDAGGFPIGPDGWRYWDLNQNGQKDSDEDLNLKFVIRSDDDHLQNIGNFIADELEAVKVKVTRLYYNTNYVVWSKDFHLYTGYYSLGVDPDHLINWNWDYHWHPSSCANYAGINNPDFNEYTLGVRYPDTLEAAKTYAWLAQEAFASEALSIPLWSYIGSKAMSRYYTGGNTWIPVEPDDGENAYRRDENDNPIIWEGAVNMPGYGVDNIWSFMNMHPKGYLRSGTVRWGFSTSSIGLFNPIYAASPSDWKVLNLIYDTLLRRNPNNLAELMPWLAESYQVGTYLHPTYGNCSKVRFTLRPNATWQDGTPITAYDVYFTFVELKKILATRGFPKPWWWSNVENILSFRTLDPYNFEVLLDVPTMFATGWIGENIILPAHIWKPIAETGDPQAFAPDPNQIGSGPWRFKEYIDYGHVLLYANRPTLTVQTSHPGSTPVTSSKGYWRYHPSLAESKVDGALTAKVDYYTQPKTVDYIIHNRHLDNPIAVNLFVTHPDETIHSETDNTILAGGSWTHSWTGDIKGKKTTAITVEVTSPGELAGTYSWSRVLYGTINEDITGSTFYDDIGLSTYPYKSQLPSPDTKVDLKDIAVAAKAFGAYPGHDRWNPVADINGDYKIDIRDTAAISKEYGWVG